MEYRDAKNSRGPFFSRHEQGLFRDRDFHFLGRKTLKEWGTDEPYQVSYADRKGKYQKQQRIVLPKLSSLPLLGRGRDFWATPEPFQEQQKGPLSGEQPSGALVSCKEKGTVLENCALSY